MTPAPFRLFRPDFANRIDLPGAGPCPRPVDLDRARTGQADLVSLRIYRFAAGAAIAGEAEEDEVFVALLAGTVELTALVDGAIVGRHGLDAQGGARALYLPPHAAYRLVTADGCDLAYARARPAAARWPAARAFAAADGGLRIDDHAVGMGLRLATLAAGATLALDDGGPATERLVHLRGDGAALATVAGLALGDWDTAALTGPATLRAGAPATVLAIAARPAA